MFRALTQRDPRACIAGVIRVRAIIRGERNGQRLR